MKFVKCLAMYLVYSKDPIMLATIAVRSNEKECESTL